MQPCYNYPMYQNSNPLINSNYFTPTYYNPCNYIGQQMVPLVPAPIPPSCLPIPSTNRIPRKPCIQLSLLLPNILTNLEDVELTPNFSLNFVLTISNKIYRFVYSNRNDTSDPLINTNTLRLIQGTSQCNNNYLVVNTRNQQQPIKLTIEGFTYNQVTYNQTTITIERRSGNWFTPKLTGSDGSSFYFTGIICYDNNNWSLRHIGFAIL